MRFVHFLRRPAVAFTLQPRRAHFLSGVRPASLGAATEGGGGRRDGVDVGNFFCQGLVHVLLRAGDVKGRPLPERFQHGSVFLHEGHQDGDQRIPLEVQEPLGEGCRAHCHTAFVGGVDFKVVAVGRVQAQEPAPLRPVVGVHHGPENLSELLRLRPARMGEDATVLDDEQCL